MHEKVSVISSFTVHSFILAILITLSQSGNISSASTPVRSLSNSLNYGTSRLEFWNNICIDSSSLLGVNVLY
jgi:hypothetical protein